MTTTVDLRTAPLTSIRSRDLRGPERDLWAGEEALWDRMQATWSPWTAELRGTGVAP